MNSPESGNACPSSSPPALCRSLEPSWLGLLSQAHPQKSLTEQVSQKQAAKLRLSTTTLKLSQVQLFTMVRPVPQQSQGGSCSWDRLAHFSAPRTGGASDVRAPAAAAGQSQGRRCRQLIHANKDRPELRGNQSKANVGGGVLCLRDAQAFLHGAAPATTDTPKTDTPC